MKRVILISADLVFIAQVQGAARAAGRTLTAVSQADQAVAVCEEDAPAAVLIDLTSPNLVVADAVARLKALDSPPGRILAFGPHVHEQRLADARSAGCDEVLSRGQFHARMGEILSRME